MFLQLTGSYIDLSAIVDSIEEAHDQYLKYGKGTFTCLICDDGKSYDGIKKHAMEHIRKCHRDIDDDLQSENTMKMRKLFIFETKPRTFECLFCNNILKGSLANAKDHMTSVHRNIAKRLGLFQRKKEHIKNKNNHKSFEF